MRVRFFTPEHERETAVYLQTMAAIESFWQHFRGVAEKPPSHWLSDARALLSRVHPDLGIELGPVDDGVRTMYIVSLNGATTLPLAALCVERAPGVLPWVVEVLRPAQELASALAATRCDLGLDLEEARARVGVGRGHLLDVVLSSHHFTGAMDANGQNAAEHLIAALVGDTVFDDWIGTIAIQPGRRPSLLRMVADAASDLPLTLAELAPAIEAAVRGIVAGLSERPLHTFCERAEWTMLDVEPSGEPTLRVSDSAQAASYEGQARGALVTAPGAVLPQADLMFATSICPEALKCFLAGQPFASRRFSRHGEQFCYLKLRLDAATDAQRLDRRAELEDHLNRALVPGGLGCVVGSGMGQRFAYVNLALVNVETALRVIERRLRRLGIDDDAWLLFCDDKWRDEWVSFGKARTPPPADSDEVL